MPKPYIFNINTHITQKIFLHPTLPKCKSQKLEILFNFIKKRSNAAKLLGIKKLVYKY